FYGSLLGVFILAVATRRATAMGALVGMAAGMAVVRTVAFSPWTRDIAFLWHNLIGAVVVVVVGSAISAFGRAIRASRPPFGGRERPAEAGRYVYELDLLNREWSGQVAQVDRLEGAG